MRDLRNQVHDYVESTIERVGVEDVAAAASTSQTVDQRTFRRLRPVWVAAGAALLVLILVGAPILIFSGGDSGVADQPTTTAASTTLAPTTAAPSSSPALAVLDVPLSEAVPGFTDTIVMLTTPIEGFGVMRWRPSEPMTEVALSLDRDDGWRVVLDASGEWSAQIDPDDGALTVFLVPVASGEPIEREIVGFQVEEAVWHDSESGQLAWLASPEGRDGAAILFTLDVTDQAADPVPVRSFEHGFVGVPFFDEWDGPGVTLERWGNVGVVMRSFEEDGEGDGPASLESVELVLVDMDGTETSMGSGIWWIADNPDGASMWRGEWEEPCFVLSPDGQHRSTVPGVADGEFLYDAWWSPDGTLLALYLDKHGGLSPGETVLRIVDSVSGDAITEIAEPDVEVLDGVLAWSTDSRFVVYQNWKHDADSGVLVLHDTVTDTTTIVPLSDFVDEIRLQ